MTALTDAQIERYSRQIILPEVGGRGQERLLAARVAIAGDVELAALVATLCSRAGIGGLDLPDEVAAATDPWPDCTVRRHAGGAPPSADVLVELGADLGWGRPAAATRRPYVTADLAGGRATVTTLVGRPCAMCVAGEARVAGDAPADALDAPTALAAAGVVASEVVRVLLDPSGRGRRHTVDLVDVGGGTVASRPLDGRGCALCGETA